MTQNAQMLLNRQK